MDELNEKQHAVLVELTEKQLNDLANQLDHEYQCWYCAVCKKNESHEPDCWVANSLTHLANRRKLTMANGDKPPGKDEPKPKPEPKPEQPSEPAKPQ